jgi:hypothetical protein
VRAVSLRQPWAWLAVNGHIGLFNMEWDTSYRGEFLIRTGLKLVQRDYRNLAAQLREQLNIDVPPFDDEARMPRGAIVGMACLIGVSTASTSPLFRGPFAWQIAHAQPLPFTPFKPPHRGADLRWFDVPRARAGLATPSIERTAA